MARGNLIQGQGSGKVGDIVLMVRQGQQVSRVYTASGARTGKEASEASRIQRVKFGSASNQWGLYRYVCTRMYRKGRSSKQSDYNYFVKKNSLLLPYLTKTENASGVHVLMPGQFSEGSFGRIELVHWVSPEFQEQAVGMRVSLLSGRASEQINWSSTMSNMKSVLSGIFPYARKVTYLLSLADEVQITEGGETFISQSVHHFPVIIDLFKELSSGENLLTVAQYFSARIGNSIISSIISAQSGNIIIASTLFRMIPASSEEYEIMSRLGVLIFATDDDASDCYTTVIPEDAVNPTNGAYADWASYRTAQSLRIAADSYGYQSGVMRDDIAKAGNDISAKVSAYAARLAQVDVKASEAFLKSVGDVSAVQAKVVRKSAEEK